MHALLRRAVATATATVALAGCSVLSDPVDEPDNLDVSSIADLELGCDDLGDGYPAAAKYEGEGPHPIVIFAKHLATDLDITGTTKRPDYELANSETSDGVLALPNKPSDVALLACGDTLPGGEQLNVCPYQPILNAGGRPTEIPLYSQRYTFTVYELRTGRTVDTLQLDSAMRQPASSCPTTLESATRIYAKAQPFELDTLFKELTTTTPK